jgi:magnesium transporter
MEKSIAFLIRSFAETNPDAAARAMESLEISESAAVVAQLPVEVTGPILERLGSHCAAQLFTTLGPETTQNLINRMTPKQAAVVLQHLDLELRDRLLSGGDSERIQLVREALKYPPDTAGGMMQFPVTSLPLDLTVQETIGQIRRAPRESLHYLYVTQRDGRLVGVLNMRDLLVASPLEPLERLVRRNLVTVRATMDREEVANLMRSRGFVALPVVDDDDRLLGVVRHEQVLETVEKEAFEDLQKMVGGGGDDSATTSLLTIVKHRLPWLFVNLVTAFMASTVLGMFESILLQVAALKMLLPIVAGPGGNSGAQTLAVVIRGLALKEITPANRRRVILKEATAGLVNGVSMAIVTSVVVYLWSHSAGLSLVIALALIVNTVVAGFAGAMIPLALKALGSDPAQSSSIFLSTVTDIVGFASFLGFAVLFSSWLL